MTADQIAQGFRAKGFTVDVFTATVTWPRGRPAEVTLFCVGMPTWRSVLHLASFLGVPSLWMVPEHGESFQEIAQYAEANWRHQISTSVDSWLDMDMRMICDCLQFQYKRNSRLR